MSTSVNSRTFNFRDRGRQTIRWFDLFDECEYGADKLFFRGRFESLEDVVTQVKIALLQDIDPAMETQYVAMGAGNPIFKEGDDPKTVRFAESGIGLNRWCAREGMTKWFSNRCIEYPNRARYAVHFRLRIKFHADYGYIDFGMSWASLYKKAPDYKYTITIEDLELLQCSFISDMDALLILDEFLPNAREYYAANQFTEEVVDTLKELNLSFLSSGAEEVDKDFMHFMDAFVTEDSPEDETGQEQGLYKVIVHEQEDVVVDTGDSNG